MRVEKIKGEVDMPHIKISPVDGDSYVVTNEGDCKNEKDRAAFNLALKNGWCIYHSVLAVRMSV